MTDETGRAGVALAVALRDAHFRLKHVARVWAEQAPPGAHSEPEALGPAWSYGQAPDEASYLDGQAVRYGGTTLVIELTVHFRMTGTDLSAAVHIEDEAGDGAQLVLTGPLEFPTTSHELIAELDRCLERVERLEPRALTG